MPLEADNILGVCYLAPEEFLSRARLFGAGMSINGLNAEGVKPVLAMASRAIDAHCGRSFTPDAITENHRWNGATRRISVNQPPVMTLSTYRLRTAPSQVQSFNVADVLINNQENYLELATLAAAVGMTGDLLGLGLCEAQVEVTYLSYQAIPQAVAAACGFTAAKMANMGYVSAQVPDGFQKISLGGFNATRAGLGAGDALEIPPMAQQLLSAYRRIALG
jgi:hypothetical protein